MSKHPDWRIHDHNDRWDAGDDRGIIKGRREGKTDAEIAAVLGRTRKALHSRVGRLRRSGVEVPAANRPRR